jgi:muramoyltetrapeptide carboxypeptidase
MPDLPLIFPPLLRAGDVIGIAAPASPPDKPEIIDQAVARLEAYGFRIKTGKHLPQRTGYLAGGDEERAADLNTFFADPDVRGIFALRGGYGSCRLLPILDYAALRANPKVVLGYSDITALHLAILGKAGLVTFHGPNASSAFEPQNLAWCERQLIASSASANSRKLFDRGTHPGVTTLMPGRARGPLIGGNFTCLLRLLGTPWQPDFRGAILFLEDTCEKAYRIDGNLTHLRLAGVLTQISGLVLGQFDYEADPTEPRRIEDCLRREAERLGVPCVSGAPIGHFPEQIVVPCGTIGELDATGGSLAFHLP